MSRITAEEDVQRDAFEEIIRHVTLTGAIPSPLNAAILVWARREQRRRFGWLSPIDPHLPDEVLTATAMAEIAEVERLKLRAVELEVQRQLAALGEPTEVRWAVRGGRLRPVPASELSAREIETMNAGTRGMAQALSGKRNLLRIAWTYQLGGQE